MNVGIVRRLTKGFKNIVYSCVDFACVVFWYIASCFNPKFEKKWK